MEKVDEAKINCDSVDMNNSQVNHEKMFITIVYKHAISESKI